MSDNLDSTQTDAVGTVLPGSDTSQQPGDKPNSDSLSVDTLLDRLFEDKRLDQRLQSAKDRRFQKLENGQNETKDRLDRFAELIKGGKSTIEAKQQLDNEDALTYARELYEQRSSQTATPGSVANVSGEIKGVLVALGVSQADPGVQDFLSRNTGSDAPVKLAAYIKERGKPPASPAGIQNMSTGPAPHTDATEKYKQDMIAARGNRRLILQIKDTARKQGVDVDRDRKSVV